MLNAKISGSASYLPDYVLTNDELSRMVDTNDEWITTRVGIKERRILKKEVGSSYMGIQAVKKLLEEASNRARKVLLANKKYLDELAEALLKDETLEEERVSEILKGTKLPEGAELY